MDAVNDAIIRQLFEDYLQMYSSRDDTLTTHFSQNFSGFTGGGDVLVKDQKEWIEITRHDFDQIKEPIRIDLKDLSVQALADTIAVATGFFTIHLPIKDEILSNETARLVLIFRLESEGWKISHSSISIPYHLVQDGEVYPMKEIVDRNQFLENLVTKRTTELSNANEKLKQANEKLADANKKYAKAERLGKVGNWEYDIASKEFHGSPETRRIYGFSEDAPQFTTEAIKNCMPEKEMVYQRFFDLITKNKPYNVEFDIIANDSGEQKTVNSLAELQRDESGNPVKIQGVILDITQRKKSEDALRKSEDRYRELFENAPFPYQSLDENGCILEVNRRWLEHLGYSLEEVKCKSFADFLHPDWKGHFRENFPKFKSVGEVLGIEFQLMKKDGTYIWVSFDGKIHRNRTGEFIQTHCIFTDISEQKKLQDRVAHQQDVLNQSRKMQSVGQLAGGVAHDFNNMLSIILGYAEMALEKLEPSDPLYSDMEAIYQAGAHSADITRQLLAFARQQTIDPKVLNLNNNIDGMIKMLRYLIGEDIDFSWKPGTDLWKIKIDASQIDQILANLSINARDAIVDIGKVSVETENVTFAQDYCEDHTDFFPGEYVMLAVSDDGCGIEPDSMDKIFEPFFTTKGVGEGTGLGLATVYGIMEQNNGFIKIHSEPEKGTSIRLYFPRYIEQVPLEQKNSILDDQSSQSETIVFVEDDTSLLKLGKRILEKLGYKVLATSRATEAKKIIEAHEGQVDLLLTDVVMPEMNGRELAEQLQGLHPQLKILFMSGYTANVMANRGLLTEGINFLQKPFSSKAIALKIREVLD